MYINMYNITECASVQYTLPDTTNRCFYFGNAVSLLNFTITQHSLIYSMDISLLLPGELGNAVRLLNSTAL